MGQQQQRLRQPWTPSRTASNQLRQKATFGDEDSIRRIQVGIKNQGKHRKVRGRPRGTNRKTPETIFGSEIESDRIRNECVGNIRRRKGIPNRREGGKRW